MKHPANIQRFLANWRDEMNSAALYDALAAAEGQATRKEIFQQLAEAERNHARVWLQRLDANGVGVPRFRPDFKTRLLQQLIAWFGPGFVISSVAAAEYADRNKYAGQPDAAALSGEERGHAAIVQAVAGNTVDGAGIAAAEPWHTSVASGNDLRAAVLGANDGLVSNFCLIMGVAGAGASAHTVLLTGVAGLLAGAMSMALGEWLSVTNARELAHSQLAKEAEELEQTPDAEQHELVLIYRAKGLPKADAERIASNLMKDKSKALDALAREELGLDPREMGGNPWTAAGTSFVLFSVGALLPVLPFLLLHGTSAMIGSMGLSAVGLLLVGAVTSLFNGRSAGFSALRQLLTAGVCAVLTFGLGHLFGAALT
ncbi:VIT1/CCC1 family predicted Fe2+/Mn2+ transporter [Silvimonas terrae]|uniref:VIT1/CCC1 family predicted Fe2+/Mn2+ transporter n=1 Tax=Silvimonas terrae TaxID=300266 RepID=A0A840RGT8_9NEIS|nr:VIT1/CCC1 transporter family protein [Silvimonas terrae]MBB5192545.1 VIT1/CCC1 family predicted Fe2+/Mn2+ transporter [Silvimonas terrae]